MAEEEDTAGDAANASAADETPSEESIEQLAERYKDYSADNASSGFTNHDHYAEVRRLANHILGS